MWHGPHHSAQKSTSTGVGLFKTFCSKSVSVTWIAFPATGCTSVEAISCETVLLAGFAVYQRVAGINA
jgi:hypothetical protein